MNKLKKLCYWLPIIWADEDFDFDYLLTLLAFKIKRMRLHHEKHQLITHWRHVVKEMIDAELMIANIKDDPDDEWSLHWGQWHNGIMLKDCKEKAACNTSSKLSHKRAERNWHKLWKHLDKYAQGWWD